jgi:hypothetical protein
LVKELVPLPMPMPKALKMLPLMLETHRVAQRKQRELPKKPPLPAPPKRPVVTLVARSASK